MKTVKMFRKPTAVLMGIGLLVLTLVGCNPDPNNCPAPTHWVEAQSWWSPAEEGADNFGHAHVGACLPERDTISGAAGTVPVRVILHDNPGVVAYLSIVSKTTDQEITQYKAYPSEPFTCPTGTCEKWFDMPLDPAWFNHSGLQEVRFRLFVDEPTGERMSVSLNWQVNVDNGQPVSNVTRMPYLRGKGWYTGYEYCEASWLSVPLQDGTVSGTITPTIQQVNHDASMPVTWHHVAIDSNAHTGDPGIVISDGPGQLLPTTLSIDTTQLADGLHRLVQRDDCTAPSPSTGKLQTNSGVLIVTFRVDN